jgi:hypothetical protein
LKGEKMNGITNGHPQCESAFDRVVMKERTQEPTIEELLTLWKFIGRSERWLPCWTERFIDELLRLRVRVKELERGHDLLVLVSELSAELGRDIDIHAEFQKKPDWETKSRQYFRAWDGSRFTPRFVSVLKLVEHLFEIHRPKVEKVEPAPSDFVCGRPRADQATVTPSEGAIDEETA